MQRKFQAQSWAILKSSGWPCWAYKKIKADWNREIAKVNRNWMERLESVECWCSFCSSDRFLTLFLSDFVLAYIRAYLVPNERPGVRPIGMLSSGVSWMHHGEAAKDTNRFCHTRFTHAFSLLCQQGLALLTTQRSSSQLRLGKRGPERKGAQKWIKMISYISYLHLRWTKKPIMSRNSFQSVCHFRSCHGAERLWRKCWLPQRETSELSESIAAVYA